MPLFAIFPLHLAHATTYTYDPAGRLKSATNSQGQTASYDYDSRGNLIRIERTNSSQLVIASFTPNNGPPGIQVTINGSGFASTTSSNTVAFNGVSAPVLSASSSQLLVQVPQNATTGPISVATPTSSVTSDDTFYVSTIGNPPAISGLVPMVGNVGDTLTISGQNLYPIQGETTVTIDGIFVPIATISDLQITVVVPPWVGSGAVTVTTPYGTASTGTAFYIIPIGTTPSSVALTAPLVAGGPAQSASLSSAMPNAAFLFQGAVGEYASIQAASFSNSSYGALYSVYNPMGLVITSGSLSASNPTIDLPPLTLSGTYSVILGQSGGALQISLALEINAAIAIDGVSTVVPTTGVAQNKRLTFYVPFAGENLGLGISNLVVNNGYGWLLLNVYDSNGIRWTAATCSVPQCNLNLYDAPHQGTYTVSLSPSGAPATFGLTATLSDSVSLTLPATNTPVQMNLSRTGQNGIYSFSGTAGQQVAVNLIPNGSLGFQILNPDGSTLVPPNWVSVSTYNLSLPQAGTYIIDVWPGNAPASITATLAVDAPAVPLITNGSASTVSNQLSGQFSYFTFNATAGENLGLGISNLVVQNGSGAFNVLINEPNGSVWTSGGCGAPQCGFNLWNAPATGTYTVVLQPSSSTATFSLSASVSDSVVTPLPANNTPTTMSLAIPGQTGIYNFSGTTGQQIALQFVVQGGGNSSIGIMVLNPDGSTLIAPAWAGGSTYNVTLPQTGAYAIRVWLNNGIPGGLTATLATDAAAVPVTTNGSASIVTNQLGGQFGYFTFNATAGENLGLGISNMVVQNGSGSINVQINEPNGSVWTTGGCGAPQCGFNLWNAPATGTYTVVLQPSSWTATFSLSAFVSDSVVIPLPANNTPTMMNLAIPGQTGIYTFSGVTGQEIALHFAVQSGGNSSIGIVLFNPDGSTLIGGSWAGTSTYNETLSQTGTYTIQVWLYNGIPGSLATTLASDTPNSWSGAATFDPLDAASQFNLSNANLAAALATTISGGGYVSAFGNTGVNANKWVYRAHVDSANSNVGVGIAQLGTPVAPGAFSAYATGYAATADGSSINNGASVGAGAVYGTGSIIDVAYDATNGNMWVAINGSWIGGGDPVAGILPLFTDIPSGYYVPAVFASQSGDGFTIQPPPTLTGYTAWPGEYSSTNFIDTIGHAVAANGGALVTNLQPKFGAPPSGISDPNFSSVKLLLHFEQPAAAASSGAFVAGALSYLTVPSSSDFDLTSGDWTIEGFVYPAGLSSGNSEILCKDGQAYVAYSQYDVELSPSGQLIGRIGTGTGVGALQTITSTDAVPLYTWSHIAFERSGNTISLYMNGVLEASATVSITMTGRSQPLYIGYQQGQDASNYFNGYIDELRITKGTARYSGGTYTVPTSAFPGQ